MTHATLKSPLTTRLSFAISAIEPYRLFFPIGWLHAIWGTAIWIPIGFGWSTTYPADTHAFAMIGGFLLAFASGFLMTAIPKFTATWGPTPTERLMVFVPLLIGPLAPSSVVTLGLLLVGLVGLLRFAFIRFRSRQNNPPEPFVFIGIGLASALAGLTLLFLTKLGWIPAPAAALGRLLFLHAFMLSLVLGVGSRLVPALLGWGPQPTNMPQFISASRSGRQGFFLALGISFLASYFVEWGLSALTGQLVRLGVIAVIAIDAWRLHKLPANRTKLAWGLWASAWMIVLGAVGATLMPGYQIHFHHLTFVGGLGLMTLMIATRVILAHGGFPLTLEGSMWSLLCVAGLVALAALTRLSAGFLPNAYLTHLAYASITWIVALGWWWWAVGRRILRALPGLEDEENC